MYEKICTQMCWFPNKHIIFDGRGVERGGGGVGGSRFAGWPAQYSTVSKYNNSGSIRVQLNPVDDGQISNLS